MIFDIGLLLEEIIGKPNDIASRTINGKFSHVEANKNNVDF